MTCLRQPKKSNDLESYNQSVNQTGKILRFYVIARAGAKASEPAGYLNRYAYR